MTDRKNRIQYVDMARGMAIHMIVMSHVLRRGVLADYLATCAISVFIILSGIVSEIRQREKGTETGQKIMTGSRCRRLSSGWMGYTWRRFYVPYLAAGIVSILVYRMLGSFAAQQIGISLQVTSLWDNLKALIYANAKDGSMKWNESLWYIPCHIAILLMARLADWLYEKWIYGKHFCGTGFDGKRHAGRRQRSRILFILALVMAGGFLSQQPGIRLPFQAETAVLLLAFYEFGRAAADTPLFRRDEPAGRKWQGAAAGGLISAGLLWSAVAGQISIRMDQYPEYVPAILMMACSGTGWILAARALFGPGRAEDTTSAARAVRAYLDLSGRHSLWILMWNKFPVLVFQAILPLVPGWSIRNLYMENDSAAGLLVSLPIAAICTALCLIWLHLYENLRLRLRNQNRPADA